MPFEGGHQAEIVEHLGSEIERHLADSIEQFGGEFDGLADQWASSFAGLAEGEVEEDFEISEQLSDFIVQFVRDEPAFLLLDFDEAEGEGAEPFAAVADLVLALSAHLDFITEGGVGMRKFDSAVFDSLFEFVVGGAQCGLGLLDSEDGFDASDQFAGLDGASDVAIGSGFEAGDLVSGGDFAMGH